MKNSFVRRRARTPESRGIAADPDAAPDLSKSVAGRSAEAEHRGILRQALVGEDDVSFDKLAADLRKLTRDRKQTPSEILLREGRHER